MPTLGNSRHFDDNLEPPFIKTVCPWSQLRSFQAYKDGGFTCFAAGVSGRNAYDLVAWSLGFDHRRMTREEHRATMETCQALRYVPEAEPAQATAPRRTLKIPA